MLEAADFEFIVINNFPDKRILVLNIEAVFVTKTICVIM